MAKIKDNFKISTAASYPVNTKHYEQNHITTQCFMRPAPVFCREKKASSDFKVYHEDFIRCNPMPVPTFGRAMVYDRAFFVPFRTIFRDWNEFIVSTLTHSIPGSMVMTNNVPLISNSTLLSLLLNNSSLAQAASDFILLKSDNSTERRVFTDSGVYIYKVLLSLGYEVNFNENDSSYYSALPLYAFMRVILDWYYPSQYAYNSVFANIDYYLQCNNASSTPMPVSVIQSFFDDACYCSYESDYFASQWDSPVGPNSTSFERAISIPDITNDASLNRIVTNSDGYVGYPNPSYRPLNGTPFVGNISNANAGNAPAGVPTQYVQDALRSLTDYTVRHRMTSVRAVDRYLAEYGINLNSEILRRSIYVGYNSFPLNFGDVMSHSDTASQGGDALGDYAGKGVGYGDGHFIYDNKDEFGMFIIVNSVIPQASFYQGQVRDTMHISCLDFWHGDFDHLGVQATSARELFVGNDGSSALSDPVSLNQTVFGFYPRYGEYASGFDRVTGLYRCDSQNGDLSGYYLNREFDQSWRPVHGIGFAQGVDWQQYNRIFYAGVKSVDNLNCVHHFEVEFTDESRPLWEQYDFENNYKQITMNVGGTTVN